MRMQPGLREQARLETFTPRLRPRALRASRRPWLRRAGFAGPVLLLPLLGTLLAAVATSGASGGVSDVLRLPLVGLLGVNLLYMALTGWPGVLGFIVRWFGGALRVDACPTGRSRTAVVMPIHNEEPAAVFAALGAMARAVAASPLSGVDFHVLSDTRDPAIAAKEEAEYAALLAEGSDLGIHYRRRAVNARRKVGNLADFCATWGEHYDYMLVLDADSVMAPSAIERLIGLMDALQQADISKVGIATKAK